MLSRIRYNPYVDEASCLSPFVNERDKNPCVRDVLAIISVGVRREDFQRVIELQQRRSAGLSKFEHTSAFEAGLNNVRAKRHGKDQGVHNNTNIPWDRPADLMFSLSACPCPSEECEMNTCTAWSSSSETICSLSMLARFTLRNPGYLRRVRINTRYNTYACSVMCEAVLSQSLLPI